MNCIDTHTGIGSVLDGSIRID